MLMIGINWLVQFINEFFMRIVLLSFLIGLVGRSLNASSFNRAENLYKQQCEMNREASLIYRQFGLIYETGMYVLSSDLTKKETVQNKMARLKNENEELKKEITTLME